MISLDNFPDGISTRKNALIYIFLSIPVILFGYYIWLYAVNVPYVDDAELVSTINEMKDYPSEFFKMMVRQQNDHRVVFPKIGAILSYLIMGKTDFRVIKLLGFFNLVLLAYSFFLIYRSTTKGLLSFAPVIFLLFSPIVYGVHLWAITSFQYTLSVAFSLLSLYFLQQTKRDIWYWSIPLAIMATVTNLDGLSVIPIGLLWLILQRRKKESVWYLVFSVVYLLIFFQGFKFSVASKVLPFAELLPVASLSFVAFTGSFASILSDSYGFKLSMACGSVILFVFAVVELMKFRKNIGRLSFLDTLAVQFDFTEMALLRLLATAAMIGIGRSSDGPEGVLASRFLLYSVSIIILFYLLLLKVFKGRSLFIFKISAVAFSILSCAFIYAKYDSGVKQMGAELKSDSFNYTHHRVFLHQYFDLTELGPSFYRNYEFPTFFDKNAVATWQQGLANSKGTHPILANNVGKSGVYSKYYFPVTEVNLNEVPGFVPRSEVYLGIQSKSNPKNFYLLALRDLSGSWQNRLLRPSANRRFFVSIEDKIHTGNYSAAICWLENGQPRMLPLSGELTF
jgi:hypothetical protein